MEELLKRLADVKYEEEVIASKMKGLLNTILESAEYKTLEELKRVRNAEIQMLDEQIRYEAICYYMETGDKKPIEGVGIRVMTKVNYDEHKATDWCTTNLPAALTVNKKVFEKIVKEMPEESLPDYISIEEQPSATISSDLSYWQTLPKE